tara:strand:+ start:1268 stop:1540 length:273 start_codon:yes stop_codon:yes gene_type:complete
MIIRRKVLTLKNRQMNIELVINNVVIDIEYDYTMAEAPVYYDNNLEGNPGSPASVDIYNIYAEETDITDIIAEDVFDQIEEQILNYHSDE